MSDRLEKAFEYVRNNYFPGWDKRRRWKVEDCSEELNALSPRGVEGQCIRETKTIKINMTGDYVEDEDDFYVLLIHEICHCHNLGHGESWQNLMFKTADVAWRLGHLILSSRICTDVHNKVTLDKHEEHRLQLKIFVHVKEYIEKYPEISFNELMVKMVENHRVPENISDKWTKVYKGKYDYIKGRSMSPDCKHGLNPESCIHCRQKTLPEEVMPQFSTKEDKYKGNPILEILVNGNPWGETYPWDGHFRFGEINAKLILLFSDLIKEFVDTDSKRPVFGTTISRPGQKYNCTCVTSPSFNRSNGRDVYLPFMKLISGEFSIGFGTTKAKALIAVWGDIERFVNIHT